MGYHARVCNRILKKINQPYIYIDLNCGTGYQPDYRKFGDEVLGSPIIALQELNQQGIEPICHFCDASKESLEILEKTIKDLEPALSRCTAKELYNWLKLMPSKPFKHTHSFLKGEQRYQKLEKTARFKGILDILV